MFFNKCNSVEELKREYHRLAFVYHPDKGGDIAQMQAVNVEYEARLCYLVDNPQTENANYNAGREYEVGQRYKDIIGKIIRLPSIEIEICGSWIWVGGNTFSVREQLSAAGLYWAKKKCKWFWKPEEWRPKRRHQPKSMEWIRHIYGSIPIEQDELLQVGS